MTDALASAAADYALVALTNIGREFPSGVRHEMTAPGDFPHRPRDRNPVFFGSYDWHSCVEMHWMLARLLRVAGEHVPAGEIAATLDRQLTADGLRAEARFAGDPMAGGTQQRPYGWAWALMLTHEVDRLGNAEWARNLRPLADTITAKFLEWLPKATYPVRYGMHPNSAFGLSMSLPHARDRAAAGDPALLHALVGAARRWFEADRDCPGAWEPSGWDFLSPALAEAELMASVLAADRFPAWLDGFLPGIADREPAALFAPATVTDSSDGQIAHLHGLNLSRAWHWRRLADSLDASDPRVPVMRAASRAHAEAGLPHVVGGDYMVEHWLAAYAVLLLS